MQKILLLATAFFFLSVTAFAGVAPAAAEKAFIKKFPMALKVKWEKEGNNYEASFTLGGVSTSATYTGDGNWLETETSIAIKDLPKPVSDYITDKYPKAKVTEASKIERPNIDAILYEADIKENGKETELLFTADGKPTK